MVLDATLFNTKHYKEGIKGKEEQSREWNSALPYTSVCCILNTIKTIDTVLLEKYTSYFIERVVCKRELETEQNCSILTPTLMTISVSFLFSWAAQPGAWGPASLGAGFLYHILFPSGLVSKLPDFLSSLSYIIGQRPLNLPPQLAIGICTSAVFGMACLIAIERK